MVDQTVGTVGSWGDAIFVALTGALNDLVLFIPKLIGALVILLVGWLVAKAVEALVSKGLRAVRFNQVAQRAEVDGYLRQAGVRMDPASVVGKLAYWFLFLIFIGAAFNAFGLTQVNAVINQVIGFIPNVVVALVVLLVGALLAQLVANLVRGASGTARVGNPGVLATLARSAVLGFAFLIALNQLNIGAEIVNTLFFAVVGALAAATALAFGLGGREVAGRILEGWYSRRGEVAAQASRLGEATRREAQAESRSSGERPAPTSTSTGSPARERRGI